MKKIDGKMRKFFRNPGAYFLFLFFFGVIAPVPVIPATENPAEIFLQANRYYHKAEYGKAVKLYQELVDSGYESGNLYYNLGNAYFKQHQNGLAILYYEKAKRLIPTDVDLQTNLAYAITGVDEGEIDWGAEFIRNLASLAPLDRLTIISSVSFFILIVLISLTQLFPPYVKKKETGHYRLRWKITLFLGSSLFILSLFFTTVTYLDRRQPQAVLIEKTANIHVEPNSTAGVTDSLSEGARVYMLETKNDWCLIKRRDGKRGWVKLSFLEKI